MATESFAWNIVLVGAWNVAILTPDGIRKLLLQLPEGSIVDVEVAIDRPAPFRVRHNDVVIVPSSRSLDVSVEVFDVDTLKRASEIASRALKSLPATPVFAAGVNLRYRCAEISDYLLEATEITLDELLSDSGYQITGRATNRSLKLDAGSINVEIKQGDGIDGTISFNFNLDSQDCDDLTQWISRIDEFYAAAQKLLLLMKE